ncbi:hypothetical protein F4811DRAFT_555240 [Daldinia bambusicola]|nr:hypothetical protein F4811DRAFT_555240 [Daldinia bambusicola]
MPSTKYRRPDPDPEERMWEQHKPTFLRLYQTEWRTLEEVKKIMKSEHRFPVSSLSTYETKLRDELHLRKKLKKTDWVSVQYHRRKRGDKPTAVYLNGIEILQHKVWKEIRRSGALQVYNEVTGYVGQDSALPRDVIVRTPSPIGYISRDIVLGSRNAVQQSQTHVDLSMSPQAREIEQVIPTRLLPSEYRKEFHHFLAFNPLALTMGIGLEMRSSEIREAALPPPQLPIPSCTATSSALTFEMNAFYLSSKAIYMISNKMLEVLLLEYSDVVELLLSRVPYAVFRNLFQEDLPTVGLLHRGWIIPRGASYLSDAVSMNAIDVIKSLLKIGIRADDRINENEQPAVIRAAATGNMDVYSY